VIHDPKLKRVSPAGRWLWIAFLCLANDDGELLIVPGEPLTVAEIGEMAGVTDQDELARSVAWFKRAEMLDEQEGILKLTKWGVRQYRADSSAERTRRYRKRKQNTDTDTDTDTEQKRHRDGHGDGHGDAKKTVTKKNGSPKGFKRPTVAEVEKYCSERGNDIDAEAFVDYYEARGWQLKSGVMKDWRAAVRTWEKNSFQGGRKKQRAGEAPTTTGFHPDDVRMFSGCSDWDLFCEYVLSVPPGAGARYQDWKERGL